MEAETEREKRKQRGANGRLRRIETWRGKEIEERGDRRREIKTKAREGERDRERNGSEKNMRGWEKRGEEERREEKSGCSQDVTGARQGFSRLSFTLFKLSQPLRLKFYQDGHH